MNRTPRQIVEELDKHIVGQDEAKRAVAIALRNRYRRQLLPEAMRDEVTPKNILMIGPTGVGKTEIARRLARLADAPFVKVEATKFTEVGYVGRDVESMVRDLVETALRMVKAEHMSRVQRQAEALAEDRLVEILVPAPRRQGMGPFGAFFGMQGGATAGGTDGDTEGEERSLKERRESARQQLRLGEMEDRVIEVEVSDTKPAMLELFPGGGSEEVGVNIQDLLGGMLPQRKRKRKVPIGEARKLLAQEEGQKLIDMDEVTAEAIGKVEQTGIIFLDEIDKIAGENASGPDVSREGVQRDILPIVEGATVMTKYGPVRTDHILFIAAGAFHISKPSDLIPELQGRLPIRVELKSLTRNDFKRILTEPESALLRQYGALLSTEGVELTFEESAIDALAELAEQVNAETENIGARRLQTLSERLLEDISFEAPERRGESIAVDGDFVRERLRDLANDRDLSRYVL